MTEGVFVNIAEPVGSKERHSGIELLKVIAILLVVVSHVVQTLDNFVSLSEATQNISRMVLTILRYSGNMGNLIFMVCSAWFLLDSQKTKRQKILNMIGDVWVISIIYLVIFLIGGWYKLSFLDIISSIFPTISANNWYITCYLLIYAVHPLLNRLIKNMSRRELLVFVLFTILLYIVINVFRPEAFFPSRLVRFVLTYFIIAYIKLYMPKYVANVKLNVVLLVVGIVVGIATIVITNIVGLHLDAVSSQLLIWNNTFAPFMFLIGISLFNIHSQMKFKSKIVNKISALSMLIYIIHENVLFRGHVRPVIWKLLLDNFAWKYVVPWAFALVAMLFLAALILSLLYSLTLQKFVHFVLKKFNDWISPKCSKVVDKMLKD